MTHSKQGSWGVVSDNPWFLSSAGSQYQLCSEYIWPKIDGLTMFEQVIHPGMERISRHLENSVRNRNISSLGTWSDNYEWVSPVFSSALDSIIFYLAVLVQFREVRKLLCANCHSPQGTAHQLWAAAGQWSHWTPQLFTPALSSELDKWSVQGSYGNHESSESLPHPFPAGKMQLLSSPPVPLGKHRGVQDTIKNLDPCSSPTLILL